MKLSKAEAVLLLYDKFTENHFVVKEDFLNEVEISDLTFRRYIGDIRCYLMEFHPNKEILYRKGDGVYHLKEIR
jgi:hypothetical protein